MENIIFAYTRKEAIEDGMLIEEPVETLRKECGVSFPCVMSHDLFVALEPTEKEADVGQSMKGRVWDMLSIFRVVAKKTQGPEFCYKFLVLKEADLENPIEFEVKVHVGPGDEGEGVLTFMLPEED